MANCWSALVLTEITGDNTIRHDIKQNHDVCFLNGYVLVHSVGRGHAYERCVIQRTLLCTTFAVCNILVTL